uniref:Variant surface glycoprotein 1125.1633 n=1 Tax=Trypanosoma brucei TaxID=5691 RepID=A0A1J0R7P6_9TRYP|nr:variant surface glycoprotein 1125.1633 [Trypanosoma brucei]
MFRLYTTVLALAVMESTQRGAKAAENDAAATAVSNFCEEQFYLQKVAAHLKNKLDALQTLAEGQRQEARKYRIAAAVEPAADKRCLIKALETLAVRTAEANEDASERHKGVVETALQQIEKQQKVIAANHAMASLEITIGGATSSTRQGGSGNVIHVDTTAKGSEGPCDQKAVISAGTIQGHRPDPSKVHTLRYTKHAKLSEALQYDKVLITAQSSCTHNGLAKAKFAAAMNACTFNGVDGNIGEQKAAYL